jgi:Tol biopolymer transport system component
VYFLRKYSIAAIFIFFFSLEGYSQFYTGSQLQFGKNRVKYEKFHWTYYTYPNYKVYFYKGGELTAKYVGEKAAGYIRQICSYMDYQTDREIDFIVYNKQSEYAESNIGLQQNEQYNTGGENHIVSRKVTVYVDGDHRDLDEQIRLGIAEVIFQEMMYGGSLTNVIKSSTLYNIPPWFEQGFVHYIASGWNTKIDGYVRDGIETGRYKKFNRLTGQDATYAGISIWNYIAQSYGESVIPQVLYIARSSRSIESAFLYSLGTSLKLFSNDWIGYYETQYKKETPKDALPKKQPIILKPKSNTKYYKLEASPEGRYVAYATNELGQCRVWLYDNLKRQSKCILKQGQKINRVYDYSYPLIAWHPSGELFSIIMESDGILKLFTYTLSSHKLESRRIMNFQKILDFSYSDDGTKFAMSAIQDGQSDIYVFTAGSNAYEQITKDVYDDMNPRFIDNSTKIIFSSNRPDDSLRNGGDFNKMQPHYDIFEYNLLTHSKALTRVTHTPAIDETYPAPYCPGYITYLSNASGVVNRNIARIDSSISFVDTSAHYRYNVHSFAISDYSHNIIEQDASPYLRFMTEIFYQNGKYYLYKDTLPEKLTSFVTLTPQPTSYMRQFLTSERRKIFDDSISRLSILKKDTNALIIKYPSEPEKKEPVKTDTTKPKTPADTAHKDPYHLPVNINSYSFDEPGAPAEKPVVKPIPPPPPVQTTIVYSGNVITPVPKDTTVRRHILSADNYYVSFKPSYINTQLNNTYISNSYEPFTTNAGPTILSPGLGFNISLTGLQDLFEDYDISGGVRMAPFSNTDYYLTYDDQSSRLEKELMLHRGSFLGVSDGPYPANIYSMDATYELKWPFSEVARIEGSAGILDEKNITLAVDVPSLETPAITTVMPHLEMDYVYDATIPAGLNIYSGLRARGFIQYFDDLSQVKTGMYILGMDIRYYKKIHRELIWANRFSAGTSFGQEHLLYYMGGVDGWFNPTFSNITGTTPGQNYVFQTLATPMRGFDQNVRNGTNFMLYNTEIRFPIFRYLLNRPIKSDFFNNFQLISFLDVGTAWTGATPYSTINSINTTVVGSAGNPVTVIISTQQYPFVEGFGEGVRTRILGYFVRLDEAWGVNNGSISSGPVTYFSFSLDF